MKKENISTERFYEIQELLTQSNLVVYYDFENIRNAQQLIDELLDKVKRLQTLGFSFSESIKIIFYGDKLQERFLCEYHFHLFKDYFENNIYDQLSQGRQ